MLLTPAENAPQISLFFYPAFTLFYTFSVITLLFIISKLVQQVTGKFTALSAMFVFSGFTAIFYGTAVSPERLVNV